MSTALPESEIKTPDCGSICSERRSGPPLSKGVTRSAGKTMATVGSCTAWNNTLPSTHAKGAGCRLASNLLAARTTSITTN